MISWYWLISLQQTMKTIPKHYLYRGYPRVPPILEKPHLVDKMRLRRKNNWTYYGKSEEILSFSDKLDIWIFNKGYKYKHFVQ